MMKNIFLITIFSLAGLAIYFLGNSSVSKIETSEVIRSKEQTKKIIPKINLPVLSFTVPEKNQLDELTAKIVGLDSSIDLEERNSLVRDLKKRDLSQKDFEAFFAFLKMNPEKRGAQLSWHSLKNDLLTFVIVDGRYKETTGQLMIDIVNDQEQHEVMREYVIQYIPDYFERHWLNIKGKNRNQKSDLSEEETSLQQAFVKSMWNLLKDKSGPIPGTSLIRLHELSKIFTVIDESKVDEATERLIMDTTMPVSSRMAALSVASERGLDQILIKAEEIIFDSSNAVCLRMSALNAACNLNPDDTLIGKIQKQFIDENLEDKRLVRAAYLSLKKLNKNRG